MSGKGGGERENPRGIREKKSSSGVKGPPCELVAKIAAVVL
jgi:hypothetical protein